MAAVSMPTWLKSLSHVEIKFSVSQVTEEIDHCGPLSESFHIFEHVCLIVVI